MKFSDIFNREGGKSSSAPENDYKEQKFSNDFGGTNPWSYYSSGGIVDEYYAPTIKYFTTFKTVEGDVAINYDILNGLYRRTIVGRIIDKITKDSVRIGFKINCLDKNDKPHKKALQITDEITEKIRRRDLKKLYRDRLLYGDAYLYIQRGEDATGLTDIERTFAVNSRYIWPRLDSMLQLIGWYYNSKERGAIEIELPDLMHIPRNPITGELFGLSLLEAVIEVLNLILNSQLNLAVILDHFAIPFVHWLIDSKDERRKTPMAEIKKFIRRLASMKTGSDIVTDSSIKTEILGVSDKVIDFTSFLDKFDQYMYITAGVPGQILGADADNLSAITRQMQTYYEDLIDEIEDMVEYLITDLYKPELQKAGINDVKTIYAFYNVPQLEQLSRSVQGVGYALQADLIDRKEGRHYLGWLGEPPVESNHFNMSFGDTEYQAKTSSPDGNAGASKTGPDFDKKTKGKPSVGRG